MICLIDNYDSFTYNLVDLFELEGHEVCVLKNDIPLTDEIFHLWEGASGFVLSPGPGRPESGGHSNLIIEKFHRIKPILGVCLGHQAMATQFGGRAINGRRIMHGRLDSIHHGGTGVFNGLGSPFQAMRYNSLIVEEQSLPECLEVTAWSEYEGQREVMGLSHRDYPMHGIQFHPESILSENGTELIKNFLNNLSST